MRNQNKKPIFFTLEREALIGSGITKESRIHYYEKRLDHLYQLAPFELKGTGGLINRARALFDWLWAEKPFRYKTSGPFKLNQVIDAQLSDSMQPVGNCLGLTLLYNCLLRKSGIFAKALYMGNPFGRGPHVITILRTGKEFVDIENILPDGFDYQGHLHRPSRTRWGDKELIADIYLSRGNECFEKGDLNESLRNYEKAIRMNPAYERAHLNKTILMGEMAEK